MEVNCFIQVLTCSKLQTPNSGNSACLCPKKDWRLSGVIWIGQDVVTKLRSDQISFICTSPCHNKIISGCFTCQSRSRPHSYKPVFSTKSKHWGNSGMEKLPFKWQLFWEPLSLVSLICTKTVTYVYHIKIHMKSCSIRLLKPIPGLFWVPTRPLGGHKWLKWWVFITLCNHSVASYEDSPRKQEVLVSQAHMVQLSSSSTCVTRHSVRANLYTNI